MVENLYAISTVGPLPNENPHNIIYDN